MVKYSVYLPFVFHLFQCLRFRLNRTYFIDEVGRGNILCKQKIIFISNVLYPCQLHIYSILQKYTNYTTNTLTIQQIHIQKVLYSCILFFLNRKCIFVIQFESSREMAAIFYSSFQGRVSHDSMTTTYGNDIFFKFHWHYVTCKHYQHNAVYIKQFAFKFDVL